MYRHTHPRGMRPGFRGPGHSGPRPTQPSRGYSHHQWRRPLYNAPSTENREEHWCETCDRGFPSIELLDKHKQQHQKCNIDGCQFIAHPKVITKHIQMQHSSGLYKKIAKLDNLEEIQKWREERKKKYPTRSNIEKKAAECKEKIERGEKMALNRQKRNFEPKHADGAANYKRNNGYDRNNKTHKSDRANFKRKPQHNNNVKNTQIPNKRQRTTPGIPLTVEKNKLQPFTGILGILDLTDADEECDTNKTKECSNDLIEDDYYEESFELKAIKNTDNSQEPIVCGALTTLMCDYGSSEEETDNKKNVKAVNPTSQCPSQNNTICRNTTRTIETQNTVKAMEPVKIVNTDDQNRTTEADKEQDHKSDDDSGPEEVKLEKLTNSELNNTPTKQSTSMHNHIKPKSVKYIPPTNQKQVHKFRHKVPSTLLHKLLHNEIRKERNIVLQCIRYLRKKSYFDNIKNK